MVLGIIKKYNAALLINDEYQNTDASIHGWTDGGAWRCKSYQQLFVEMTFLRA